MSAKSVTKQIGEYKVIVTPHEPLDGLDLMGKIKAAGGNLLRRDIVTNLLKRTTVVAPNTKGKKQTHDLSEAKLIDEAFSGDLKALTEVVALVSEINFGFLNGKRNADTAPPPDAETDPDPSAST